jgi:hypothetical protein
VLPGVAGERAARDQRLYRFKTILSTPGSPVIFLGGACDGGLRTGKGGQPVRDCPHFLGALTPVLRVMHPIRPALPFVSKGYQTAMSESSLVLSGHTHE